MSTCSPSSVSQAIESELPVCSYNCEKLNTKNQRSFVCDVEEIASVMSEDLDILSIAEEQYVSVPVVELDCGEIAMCHGTGTSDLGDALFSNEANICPELSQFLSLEAKPQKLLSKCKTFPGSRGMRAHPSIRNADSLDAAAQSRDSSAIETSSYACSMSLPSSSTLVSAMKGGRAISGAIVNQELRVKWAPEVYDPPATLISHTVNRHQQHPKAKKRAKHKHKGKSSQGNGGERKHVNRKRSARTTEAHNVRLQTNEDCLVPDAFDIKSEEVMECGSSFLKGSSP